MAGLGNPGAEYSGTRHNVGFKVADLLADRWRAPAWSAYLGPAAISLASFEGASVLLVKPLTYMNSAGTALKALASKSRVPPDRLIVVHDDIDLPFGRLRIRTDGGHGGHNGIRSVVDELGTSAFTRVKLGVGRPPEGVSPADHVLSGFSKEESEGAEDLIRRASLAVEAFLAHGALSAMNEFND